MANRLFTKKQLADFLKAQGQPVSLDNERYEEVTNELEDAVRARFAVELAPESALDAFLLSPGKKYGHSREMPKGRKDGMVQPFKVDDHELVDFAKPIDTEVGRASGISATLLWSKRMYKDGYTPPYVLRKHFGHVRRYDEVKAHALKAASSLKRLLETDSAVPLRKAQLRALYTPNRWGRFIWPTKGSLEAGTSLPATGPAIDDKLLNMLLNFFGDAKVLQSLRFPRGIVTGGHTEYRWLLVAPARIARIIRKTK
ncbi:MAG: hypothetical protein IPK87_00700 [Planctomycetes bacterium]|nr:hypothetical protein [Planctomycetota bacterium]